MDDVEPRSRLTRGSTRTRHGAHFDERRARQGPRRGIASAGHEDALGRLGDERVVFGVERHKQANAACRAQAVHESGVAQRRELGDPAPTHETLDPDRAACAELA